MLNISRRAIYLARLCRIMLTIVVVIVLSPRAMALDLSVEITEKAVIKNARTSLAALARVACDDLDMLKKAARATIVVERGYITPQDIVAALSDAGIGGVTLRLSMADRVSVRAETRIESWLANKAGWPGVVVTEEAYSVPPGYTADPPARLYPGTDTVNLKLKGRSGNRTEPIHLRWKLVSVVADRVLPRGRKIKAEDLAVKTVDFERNRSYFSDVSDLVGKVVNRDMAKDEPFIERQTEQPDVIKSGDRVRIVYNRGSLHVWAEGKAMESGVPGDTIKVRNLRTRKIILGVIKNSRTVEVNDR